MSIEKLTLEVVKSEDAGDMEVFVTYKVTFNEVTETFLKRLKGSSYQSGMSLILLNDEKVKTFISKKS